MKITYFDILHFLWSRRVQGMIDPFLTGNPHTNKTPEDLKEISHILSPTVMGTTRIPLKLQRNGTP